MNRSLSSLILGAALLSSPALAYPERAAQQAGDQAPAEAAPAMPAGMGGMPAGMGGMPAGMGGMPEGDFPPAMMEALAAQAQAQGEPAEPIAAPAATLAEPSASPAAEPVPELSQRPAGAPVTDLAEVHRRAQAIAEGLRCPVCQGLSAADSQAESAIAMRTRAGDLVAAGYNDQQILAYFVERYGEWVLLEPPKHGRHWLVWLGPLVLLALGALVLAWRMTAESKQASGQTLAQKGAEDPYVRRILDELDRS